MSGGARRGALLSLVLALGLAGCGNPAPEPARFVPPHPSTTELEGPLRARYNLLPTLALGEAVAREYGVERDAGTALLVVALRRPTADGDETGAVGEVSAEVVDLAGRRQAVAMPTDAGRSSTSSAVSERRVCIPRQRWVFSDRRGRSGAIGGRPRGASNVRARGIAPAPHPSGPGGHATRAPSGDKGPLRGPGEVP